MESIIRLNHRNKTQFKDIVNYINTIEKNNENNKIA